MYGVNEIQRGHDELVGSTGQTPVPPANPFGYRVIVRIEVVLFGVLLETSQ